MHRLRFASAISLGLVCFVLIGCMQVKEADVPGTYKAHADWGNSTLTLSKDHTFQQTVRLDSGVTKQINGKWKLVPPSENSVVYDITLVPYLNIQHDKQGVYAPWSFSSINPGFGGGMEIAADPDYGIAFRK